MRPPVEPVFEHLRLLFTGQLKIVAITALLLLLSNSGASVLAY